MTFFRSVLVLTTCLLCACDSDGCSPSEASEGHRDSARTSATSLDAHADSSKGGKAADASKDAPPKGVDAALPARVVIAQGQDAPTGIAVDASFVYFANRDAGTIVKCPLRGCGTARPQEIISGQDHPIALSLDGANLYWATGWNEGETGMPPSRPVFRCQLADCAGSVEAVDHGSYQPYGVTVVGGQMYLASWPFLAVCSKQGCAQMSAQLGMGPFVSIDVDDTGIYVAEFGRSQVRHCPLEGCSAEPAFMDQVKAMSVVVDGTRVYVADFDFIRWPPPEPGAGERPARIVSCPLAGCPATGPTEVESGEISPYALAELGDRLYFTNVVQGTVVSIAK